jgi:drug/metabolite transporter (DMT)-like permease
LAAAVRCWRIKYSNISIGVVCFSLAGFFTALLDPIINRKRFSVPELLLSGLTLCGIALIFHFDVSYRIGIMLGVISSIIVSLFTISNERLAKTFDTQTITLFQISGGWLALSCLMPVYLAFFPAASLWPSGNDLFYLLLLSVFCTIILYSLATQAMRRIPAFTVNLSFNLEPIYSIVLAIIIFKENRQMTPAFYAGVALILLSVVLTTLRRQ